MNRPFQFAGPAVGDNVGDNRACREVCFRAPCLRPTEVDVIDGAESGDGTEQAKQHVETGIHAQGFDHPDGAGGQQTKNGKTDDGVSTGTGLRDSSLIFNLCISGHKPALKTLSFIDHTRSSREKVSIAERPRELAPCRSLILIIY